MVPPTTVLYFRLLHSHFSTDFNIETHFGLAKLSTSIFIRPEIIKFEMESIFKMAIFTFIHPSVGALYFGHFQTYSLQIKSSIRINDTFGFFDSMSIGSEIELGLGFSQIMVFLILFHHLLRIFPIPLTFRVDPMIYFGSSNH
jgi:hypothetical protein